MVRGIVKQEDSVISPLWIFQVKLGHQLLQKEKDSAAVVGALVCSEEQPPIARDAHDERHLTHAITLQL